LVIKPKQNFSIGAPFLIPSAPGGRLKGGKFNPARKPTRRRGSQQVFFLKFEHRKQKHVALPGRGKARTTKKKGGWTPLIPEEVNSSEEQGDPESPLAGPGAKPNKKSEGEIAKTTDREKKAPLPGGWGSTFSKRGGKRKKSPTEEKTHKTGENKGLGKKGTRGCRQIGGGHQKQTNRGPRHPTPRQKGPQTSDG